MGCTLNELGNRMSAHEFGLHLALHHGEPLLAAHHAALGTLMAAIANGTLKTPADRLWQASDFVRTPWAPPEPVAAAPAAPQTVADIMAVMGLPGAGR